MSIVKFCLKLVIKCVVIYLVLDQLGIVLPKRMSDFFNFVVFNGIANETRIIEHINMTMVNTTKVHLMEAPLTEPGCSHLNIRIVFGENNCIIAWGTSMWAFFGRNGSKVENVFSVQTGHDWNNGLARDWSNFNSRDDGFKERITKFIENEKQKKHWIDNWMGLLTPIGIGYFVNVKERLEHFFEYRNTLYFHIEYVNDARMDKSNLYIGIFKFKLCIVSTKTVQITIRRGQGLVDQDTGGAVVIGSVTSGQVVIYGLNSFGVFQKLKVQGPRVEVKNEQVGIVVINVGMDANE